ncbi:MAG: Ig-like domain-containing protein [Prevotellaceae bacterium]|jgi:hypothetical protein|nr:Ig-like domain-containing protein [Prevotellaceae bacterium]
MTTKLNQYTKAVACLLAGWLAVGGCSDNYTYNPDYAAYDHVKMTFNQLEENTLTVIAGNSSILSFSYEPAGRELDNRSLKFELEDADFVQIDAEGVITTSTDWLSETRTTKLTATFKGNPKVTAWCNLTVVRNPVLVTDIKMPAKYFIQIDTEFDYSQVVTVIPGNADNQVLTYRSSDPAIAPIDPVTGAIRGLKDGTVTITACATDGSEIVRTGEVTVRSTIPVVGITVPTALNGKSVPVGQNINIGRLITVEPLNASDKSMTYELLEGEGLVAVSPDGIITPLAPGNVRMKISANGSDEELSSVVNFSVNDTEALFQRALWSGSSNIIYSTGNDHAVDGNYGPISNLFDGNASSYAVLTKPGKNYSGCATPAGYDLAVIIDMGATNTFDYVYYMHRNNNGYQYLRVWGIMLEGSEDGEHYTPIGDYDLPHNNDGKNTGSGGGNYTKPILIDLPVCNYRYIKMHLTKWSDNSGGDKSGSTMQLGEFNVGKRK